MPKGHGGEQRRGAIVIKNASDTTHSLVPPYLNSLISDMMPNSVSRGFGSPLRTTLVNVSFKLGSLYCGLSWFNSFPLIRSKGIPS